MAQIPVTVQCPIAGFETFAVTYDMMASSKQVEAFSRSIGETDFDRSAVIVDMHGWPEADYPGGAFSENTPMAVWVWMLRTGYGKAVAEYANSPF